MRIEKEFKNKKCLLGIDIDGVKHWLALPSWDCGWYWGFGYIQTKNSHMHADNFMAEYFTEWNGSKPILKDRTFTENEGWLLSELFKQFYHWSKHAEIIGRGGCHCVKIDDIKWYKGSEKYYKIEVKKINEEIIPDITARIIKILTPKKHNGKAKTL